MSAGEGAVSNIAKINLNEISQYYGNVKQEVHLSDERIEHIKSRHPEDYKKYGDKIIEAIEYPDLVVDDRKNPMTAMFIKKSDNPGINVVVKLALKDESDESFVVTMHAIGEKRLKTLLRHSKIIYNRK